MVLELRLKEVVSYLDKKSLIFESAGESAALFFEERERERRSKEKLRARAGAALEKFAMSASASGAPKIKERAILCLLPHLVLAEAVINLPLPILYILSTPNLSEFLKNWMNDNFLTPVISLINILYHILCTLIGKIRNTPPTYPTIESI